MNYLPQEKILPDVVVDANLCAAAVLEIKGMESAPLLFHNWIGEKRKLFAPDWWRSEVITIFRKHVFHKLITPEEAHQAIDDLDILDVTVLSLDKPLYHTALDWAEKIGQSKAYDSVYLALAESLNAEFWTADQRLVNSARAIKISWVKWIGDSN
jgi:predicted nucleic acid-binding protein